ncbi:hypothetical protein ACFLY0_00655 [Patescibacteria group bacterium]
MDIQHGLKTDIQEKLKIAQNEFSKEKQDNAIKKLEEQIEKNIKRSKKEEKHDDDKKEKKHHHDEEDDGKDKKDKKKKDHDDDHEDEHNKNKQHISNSDAQTIMSVVKKLKDSIMNI